MSPSRLPDTGVHVPAGGRLGRRDADPEQASPDSCMARRLWLEQGEGWLCVHLAGSRQGQYVRFCFQLASLHRWSEIQFTSPSRTTYPKLHRALTYPILPFPSLPLPSFLSPSLPRSNGDPLNWVHSPWRGRYLPGEKYAVLPQCSCDERRSVDSSHPRLKMAESHRSVITPLSSPMSAPTVWPSSGQLATAGRPARV